LFNKYYQEELAFLRELGAEFARANPAAAPFLAERGADPDVERLLEGFAFLAGRLRQKLDDEFPELTQSLLQVLWPHYLRPVPAMTIVQFEPLPNRLREPQLIPRGTELEATPVEETSCRFRTCFDVQMLPLTVGSAAIETPAGTVGTLRLGFRLSGGGWLEEHGLDRLRLFIHGDPVNAFSIYLHLTRKVKQIVVRPSGGSIGGPQLTLPPDSIQPAGFEDNEALLPYPANAFPGYRLLQEYFALPQKFLFLELTGLGGLARLGGGQAFDVICELSEPPDAELRLSPDNLRLHCAPVANLFSAQSDPIRANHERIEHTVRAEGFEPAHAEVFSVDRAVGWARGTAEERELPSFASFRHEPSDPKGNGAIYFDTRLRESVLGRGVDTSVSFVTPSGESTLPPTETVVLDLTCTNRDLPSKLSVGDVSKPTSTSPQFARFSNITPVTPTLNPPLGSGLHWRLISNMALNYVSLTDVDTFRALLSTYNYKALHDRNAAREHELRMAAITRIRSYADEHFHRGAPIRGTRIEIDVNERNFAGEGEMVLFGSVIHHFLSLYCTLNSFVRLVLRGTEEGEVYSWSPVIGQQAKI
jgi:type VI secretion system protein ImpG